MFVESFVAGVIAYFIIAAAMFIGTSLHILDSYSRACKNNWHRPNLWLHETLKMGLLSCLITSLLWPLCVLPLILFRIIAYIDKNK